MRLLVDTHALLWFLLNDRSLSTLARQAIEDPMNHPLISIASCWELSIKAGLGKMKLVEPVAVFLQRELRTNSLALLDISLAHTTFVETLPHHHKDPFDRLLIAQAQLEAIPIISADTVFDSYGVARIW